MSDKTPVKVRKHRRWVMSLMPEDEENLKIIVIHHRKTAGFPVKIAEVLRKLWRDEVTRINSLPKAPHG